MSIENDLKRIADALEKIAAKFVPIVMDTMGPVADILPGGLATIPLAKKKATPAPAPATAQTVTKEQLSDALRTCVVKVGPVQTKAILQSFNATKLSEVKEADMYRCVNALVEATNG